MFSVHVHCVLFLFINESVQLDNICNCNHSSCTYTKPQRQIKTATDPYTFNVSRNVRFGEENNAAAEGIAGLVKKFAYLFHANRSERYI